MKARSRQPAAPPRAAELATSLARRLVPQRAAALARIFTQFEAAIDHIDDVQDGARSSSALLAAHQQLLHSLLHASPELRTLLLEAGLELLRGQREDLAGLVKPRPGLPAARSASRIQERKSGALFAVFVEAVALEAKRPAQPLVQWARSYGTLLQHLSDAATLFAEDAPEDWLLLRPTRALSLPLQHKSTRARRRECRSGERRCDGRAGRAAMANVAWVGGRWTPPGPAERIVIAKREVVTAPSASPRLAGSASLLADARAGLRFFRRSVGAGAA